MKNIYGYIRVSTVKQGDGVSLEVQKRDIITFARSKNLNIVEWFEERKSASKGFRPKFNEMIERLHNKEADGFVAHKIDRMMRNRHDWAIINELIDDGCEVLSADGTTLDDVNGRFMGDIQAAVATRYSHNLAQEAKKGLYGRLAQGIYPFKAPVGYFDNGQGKLKTPDPFKTPLIQQLFDLYINKGISVLALVDKMYDLGLRNTYGKRVDKNGIIAILRNPFYAGLIRIKGQHYKGNHQPIISMNTHKKVQEILDGKINARILKHDFQFRRQITCRLCGYSLIGELQKGHTYYRCHTKECPIKTINEIEIQSQVYQLLSSIEISDSELVSMKEAINAVKGDCVQTQKDFSQTLGMKKGALKSRQERLTNLLIEGIIDNETYQEERNKILFESQQLDEQELSISSESLTFLEKIEEYLEHAKNPILSYDKGILSQKREMLKIITSNLYLEGKNIVFTMLSPFYELANRQIFALGGDDRDRPRTNIDNSICLNLNSIPVKPQPLDKAGCERFINYIIDNHINH